MECQGTIQWLYMLVVVSYQWKVKFERPVLQFYMKEITRGSNVHLESLRR